MTHRYAWVLAAALAATTARAAEGTVNTNELTSKFSYTLGMNLGSLWKGRGVDLDFDALAAGAREAAAGSPRFTEAEARDIGRQFEMENRSRLEARLREQGEKNQAAGAAFLAANKSQDGVQATPSGLQFKVLQEGTGPKPGPTDRVTVHYTGTLIDGTEFDSSVRRGQPATFPLNGVIRGWTEGLQLMPEGSKFRFFIPSELAYGARAAGPKIGPNSTLLFDVELMKVEAAPAPAAAAPQPVTSDIIKVPSAEELAKGAKIEVIKAEDAARLAEEAKKK
ncbi:MAG: FKBP-type peptidyl-prolyl cis-trans isomerase [Limisphaerales bacterium]